MRIIDQLVYKILGDSTDFDRKIDKTDKKFGTFVKNAKKVMAGIGITVSLKKVIDVTKQVVEDFAVFETTLAKTSTLFGDVAVDTDNLSAKILDLSSRTGLAADSIGESLYNALSAGIPATEDMGEALGFMESNSKLATAGFTDMDTAVSTTAKILNAYGLEVKETDRIHTILMQTQNKGITTVGELGQNLAKVTPTAAAFGVSFENVGASLATMTAQGIKTEVATTYLSGLISELGKQGTTASEALLEVAEANGMASTSMQDMLASGMSLGDVIQMMTEYANDNNMSIIDMFGSLEAGKAALAISGDNIATFNQNLAAMSTKTDVVGDAFNKMQNTVSAQSAILRTQIKNLGIAFGQSLEGPVSSVLGVLNNMIGTLTGNRDATTRLKEAYNNLASATDAYKTITSQLKNPIDNLTESEKALLEIQQKRAELKLNQAIIELGKNYADTQRKISNLKDDEEKYQGTIEQSLAIINKYTPEQREEIRNYQQQGRAVTDMLLQKRELLSAEEDLEKAQINLLSTQDKLIDENGNFNASITQIAQGVIDQQIELSTLANINTDFAETVRLQVEAMGAEKKATEDAAEAFKAYENATSEEISTAIKLLGLEEKTLANGKLIELLQKKKIELAGKVAKESENLGAKEQARNEIIEAGNKAMQSAEQYALALGDSYDLNAQKASILETTIKSLIDSGLTAEDKAVADLTAQLKALGTTTEEVTAAYAEIEKSRMSDKEKALKAIQEQADAFLEAGVDRVDVAKWQSEQIQKYEEEQTRKAQEEADKQKAIAKEKAESVRKAWEDATFSMLGSVTSIWGSINQVQANNNAQLIATLEKTTAETLKNIDKQTQAKLEAEGVALETTEERLIRERDEALATGDEITANLKTQEIRRNEIIAEADEEKKRIEDEANKRKIDMQIEEAERDKALSTLSVILDTAKAIMQIWADPLIAPWGKGLWTGLAAGAGAAQIAAINSAPVPSYDVGSIRIPETTTATVHKDEMILTAPQAEQARREGITIAPTKSGGNSINLMIYFDGREVAKTVIDNLNSGSVGTIKARVVK